MKEHSLLDVVSQIDDGFIAEAANPEILLAAQRKRRRMMLVKRVSGIAACALVAVCVVLAIPMMRLMSDVEVDDEISAAIDSAVSVNRESDMNSSDLTDASITAADSNKSDSSSETEKAAAEAAAQAAAAEAAAAKAQAEAASKAAAEAAAKAAEAASKAASEAQSMAASASSAEAAISAKTTTAVSVTENSSILESKRIGEIDFAYSDYVLFSLTVDPDSRLTSLVIPAELGGEQITELATDFWQFCDANRNLEQVTIPDTVISFGDVSYLNKNIEVICGKGSAAEVFFSANGYTIKYS